jgi:alkylhydroperoxidase family enzyme
MQTLSPRIPFVPEAQLGPEAVVGAIRQRRGGALLNLDRMLLNSPSFAVGWNGFLGAVRTGLTLAPRLRELAICAVAVLNRAPYEMLQHAPEFLQAGGTAAQLERLNDYEQALQDSQLFSALELAVLAFTHEMTLRVQVSDACFERLQAHLPSAQQQVELAGVVAAYNMVSRFLEALQVQPE